MSPLTAVRLFFFLQPIAFGSWLPRIPEVQERLGLDANALAWTLIAMPLGILATLPFAGRLVEHFGPRRSILFLTPIFLVLTAAPVFAPTRTIMFLGLALLGSSLASLELAMNVEAGRLEKKAGRNIMSACHGLWSLGVMVGGILGSLLTSLGLTPGPSVALVAALVLLPALFAALSHERDEPQPHDDSKSRHFLKPTPALLALAAFIFGIGITEGAVADWSAVYMKTVMDLPPQWVGSGYICFAAALTAMRFLGDRLIERFGAPRLAVVLVTIALVGVLMVCTAPGPLVAGLGFALIGAGVATGFPMAVTAAGHMKDRPAAASVAFVSFMALMGFLAGPVIIGWTTSEFGMRIALALLLPILLVSLLMSRALRA